MSRYDTKKKTNKNPTEKNLAGFFVSNASGGQPFQSGLLFSLPGAF